MKKVPDWEIRFDDFITKYRTREFRWGSWDCILFSNKMVEYMSGESLLPKKWRTWKNKEEALQQIIKLSKGKGLAKGIENAMALTKGWSKVKLTHLQKGDVVVYKEETELCGIYDGYACLGPTKRVKGNSIIAKTNCDIRNAWRLDG